MIEILDDSYFSELQTALPEVVCRNEHITHMPDKKQYSVTIWGDRYLIDPFGSSFDTSSITNPQPHEYFYLFILYYLLRIKDFPLVDEWISEKDLPGGPTFFRGPHLVPTHLISETFGNDIDAFSAWCKKQGGIPIDMGDAAFRFQITPDIPVVVLYWLGDEDFPAEAKILFDKSIAEQLPLDIVFALVVAVCDRVSSGRSEGS